MKRSEQLRIKGDIQKAQRVEKQELFVEQYLQEVQSSPHVSSVIDKSYVFVVTFTDGLEIDFYPQKDRVLLKKQGKWVSGGLVWLMGKIDRSELLNS